MAKPQERPSLETKGLSVRVYTVASYPTPACDTVCVHVSMRVCVCVCPYESI